MLSLSEKVSMYLARESQMASVSFEILGFSLCFAFTRAGQSSPNKGLKRRKQTMIVPLVNKITPQQGGTIPEWSKVQLIEIKITPKLKETRFATTLGTLRKICQTNLEVARLLNKIIPPRADFV